MNQKPMLYALSTCIWCKKTKMLLDALGVAYEHKYVDLLTGAEREAAVAEIKKHNPSCSYPTLIAAGQCVVGYDEDAIKGLLGK
ncbi:MAG TPA: glutaredoxin family protein [Elusimicrobiales bacterium]|nr:glutaredoxin family protein [Elusimicrobiales bacterium]